MYTDTNSDVTTTTTGKLKRIQKEIPTVYRKVIFQKDHEYKGSFPEGNGGQNAKLISDFLPELITEMYVFHFNIRFIALLV
jgi:hypothetical protein